METSQRTQDVYEQIPAYPKPPLVPLPDLDDPQTYQTLAGTLTPFSLNLSRFVVNVIGLRRAYPQFSDKIEQIQRSTNLRLPGLYAPVISATINLADDPRITDPYQRAATLLVGARSLCDELFAGTLPPDTLRGQALEMGQYPNLFGTSLVIENQQTQMFKSSNFDTITVMLGGRLYQLQVGHLGTETTAEQAAATLSKLAGAASQPDQPADALLPGILTYANDPTQIQAFSQMHSDTQSHNSLLALRHSLLTLCLDLDSQPESDAEAARLAQVGNPQNRWCHASLQIIVFGNAKACVLCNFTCYLDGSVMMRGAAEIQRRAAACQIQTEAILTAAALPDPIPLPLKVDPKFHELAWQDFNAVLDRQPATFEIEGFGSRDFKTLGISSATIFVLGLALAGRKLTGSTPRLNQFLSMSRYRCMDMFSAVVTTPEMESCIDYLESAAIDPEQARTHIQQAAASQEQAARQARSQLSLLAILNLYLFSMKKGLRRRFSMVLFSLVMLLFKRRGYFKAIRRDVLVSFPEIFPETPLIGRPGVRLPYVRQYGLHYQIFEDKTVMTFMPGLTWQTPNQEMAASIEQCLQQLKGLLVAAKPS